MFKKIIFLFALALNLLMISPAQAKELGLGVILFSPTGLSGAYVLNSKNSVDAAFSWSLNNDNQNFYAHSTYLWHQRDFFKLDKVKLSTYVGGGGRVISWEDPPGKDSDSEFRIGVRGVMGVNYYFNKPKIEIFGEISLSLDLIPSTDSDLDLGIGGRFYF